MITCLMPGYGRGMLTVSNDAPLNAFSFGLGQLFAWAAGCGVHRFSLKVDKNNLAVAVFMDPLVEPQVIQAASCSSQSDLFKWKLLPLDIPPLEQMNIDGNQGVAWDGQARFTFAKGKGLLVQTFDVKPEISIADWSFAYGDHCTGFILKGVKEIKIFHSMKLTQIHMTPSLPENEVRHMMLDAEDYPQQVLVSSIK